MNSSIQRIYRRMRDSGTNPVWALRSARIIHQFNSICDSRDNLEPEDIGAVRIVSEYDSEPYDPGDMLEPFCGSDGRWRSREENEKELNHMLETYGNYVVMSQVWNGHEWEMVDSIGGCAGYHDPCSPFENCYVPDLMRAAIEASRELTSDIVALP